MDDPIFDPWGPDAEEAGARSQPPRWRRPAAARQGAPLQRRPITARRLPRPMQSASLHEAVGVLRVSILPSLESAAQRLRLRGHDATADDLLDGDPPAVQLRVAPRAGPLDDPALRVRGVLEMRPLDTDARAISVSSVISAGDEAEQADSSISIAQLSGGRLEHLLLEFVAGVLNWA